MKKSPAADAKKYISFRLGHAVIALPIQDVLRVINYPKQNSQALNELGIARIGRHTVEILDQSKLGLSQLLSSSSTSKLPFLVILRNSIGNLVGIPTNAPPALINIETKWTRPFRSEAVSAVDIAINQIAIVPEAPEPQTIFLLSCSSQLP